MDLVGKNKQSSWKNNHSTNIKDYTQNNIENTIYHSHEWLANSSSKKKERIDYQTIFARLEKHEWLANNSFLWNCFIRRPHSYHLLDLKDPPKDLKDLIAITLWRL